MCRSVCVRKRESEYGKESERTREGERENKRQQKRAEIIEEREGASRK